MGGGLILIRVGGGGLRQCSASGGQGAWAPRPPKKGGGEGEGLYLCNLLRRRRAGNETKCRRRRRGMKIGVIREGVE